MAQAPTGSINGAVTDSSGAAIPAAKVTLTDPDTGLTRTLATGPAGNYSFPSLAAGSYHLKVAVQGFNARERSVTVVTGSATTVDFQMQVGAAKEVVEVEDAAPQMNYESNKVDGVIGRQQIQDLPLNGRSFLQLAFLEPGISVSPGNPSQYNHQFSVSVLGGDSSLTRVSVDGTNAVDFVDGDVQQNFSQEIVQEFQVSSVNFDLSTGIAGVGAINIVTRSGGNDFHGSGYFFFRDHNMAAYPALDRDPANRDPFFARRQSGFWFGGPLKKDRVFFFTNLEHLNQKGVVSAQPGGDFANFGTIYPTPYNGNQFSQRFDIHLTQKHTLFVRYSHDGNHSFGPRSGASMPSNWLHNKNWADQSMISLTSSLRPTVVNEARFAYTYWNNRNLFPNEEECPDSSLACLGARGPMIDVIGANFTIGNTDNAEQGRDIRRFIFADNLSWEKGTHRMRFGGEADKALGTGFWSFNEPATMYLYSPATIRAYNGHVPAAARLPIPASFNTYQDILSLPLAYFITGIGDPTQPPSYDFDTAKRNNRYYLYGQDTWRVRPRLTVNYGLGWAYEGGLFNHDLSKPEYLAPVLGAGNLSATRKNYRHLAPSAGFAYALTKNNKTVLRGGFGIYYSSFNAYLRLIERTYLGPIGIGRAPLPSSLIPNPYGAIPGLPSIPGVLPGTPLFFTSSPSNFRAAYVLPILPAIRQQLRGLLGDPNNTDLSVRTINIFKSGSDLLTSDFDVPYSEHFNLGIQRELMHNTVLTADFVFRQFIHTNLGNIDLNHFAAAAGPVIPPCTGGAADLLNPFKNCSAGPIEAQVAGGRNNYKALLMRLDKRMSHRLGFTASYAYQSEWGNQGDVTDANNWFDNWGPGLGHHVLNISAVYDLPKGFQISMISSMASRGPFNVVVGGADFNSDGTSNDRIPGSKQNEFNFGFGKSDLARLVNALNAQENPGVDCSAKVAGELIPGCYGLPSRYSFGDGFSSQDVRVSKTFAFRERLKLTVLGECFNIFNLSNLSGYPNDIGQKNFAQPSKRVDQVFGSGGPRAFQLAARVTF